MNRIDRVSAILIQLQSRRIVKAEHIAERFGISLRTVYRDIKTIQEAGVPLVSEPGKGYSIMEGYRLPPVQFTLEEATAFLTAEKLIEKLTDDSMGEAFHSAMYKIRSVLRSNEKEYLETIEEVIRVKENQYIPSDLGNSQVIDKILKSIYLHKQLMIDYFAGYSQETSSRKIEAIGIVFQGGHWLVISYCHLRKDYRTFRADRISGIQLTAEDLEGNHPPLDDFLQKISREKKMVRVILETPQKMLRYFGDQKYYNGFVSQEMTGDKARLFFLTASLRGFARWYLMFGDMAEILEPAELKQICIDIISGIQNNLSN